MLANSFRRLFHINIGTVSLSIHLFTGDYEQTSDEKLPAIHETDSHRQNTKDGGDNKGKTRNTGNNRGKWNGKSESKSKGTGKCTFKSPTAPLVTADTHE